MQITTNEPTIKRDSQWAWLWYDDGNSSYINLALDPDVVRVDVTGPVELAITEIRKDIATGFQFLATLERLTGAYIAGCSGSLPCGRWVVVNVSERCLTLLESPRDVSVDLGGAL